MNKFLTSSTDPNKLSLTIRGILLAILPIIMVFTGLTEAEIQPIIDGIVQLVFLLTAIVSAGQVVYGAIRKLYIGRWSAGE